MKTIEVSTEQALAFRARRNGLTSNQHGSLEDCAHRLLGAQAQVESHSYNALSLRTKGRPADGSVKSAQVDRKSLVRTWGQRDTLHLYAKKDWPLFHAASQLWVRSGRRGAIPPESLVKKAERHFDEADGPLTRSDLFPLIPKSFQEEIRDHPGATGKDGPRRFAATRLVWVLANGGKLVFGDKIGREMSYFHRRRVWSGEWPEHEPEEASIEVVRRYLGVFGPATVQDIAHYLGARVGDVRPWVDSLAKELVTCRHPERGESLLLDRDVECLRSSVGEWPLRLLPAYDTMLMSHKDKRWILPQAELEAMVWKKAAVVAAPVLVRGQIAGTWTYKKTKKKVDIAVETFPGTRLSEDDFLSECQSLAEHLQVAVGKIGIGKVS